MIFIYILKHYIPRRLTKKKFTTSKIRSTTILYNCILIIKIIEFITILY